MPNKLPLTIMKTPNMLPPLPNKLLIGPEKLHLMSIISIQHRSNTMLPLPSKPPLMPNKPPRKLPLKLKLLRTSQN